MNHTLLATAMLLLPAATIGAADAPQPTPRKPNVLVIVADDLGYGDLGVHGGKDVPTPNLDALAACGVRCTNGYVSAPYCSPSRAGLLTGRCQTRFGHEFNPHVGDETKLGLPLDQRTIADRLRGAGYATGAIGKWHLGFSAAHHPQARGFDDYFGFLVGMHNFLLHKDARARFGSAYSHDMIYRGREVQKLDGYTTDLFTDEALAFMDRHADRPWFLYLSYNAVHTPLEVLEKYGKRVPASITDPDRRGYLSLLVGLDDAVGRVVAHLRDKKQDRDTLIFFLSDNGGSGRAPFLAYNAGVNTPLRGDKGQTLEGGIRVPFFVAWPGKLPAGKTYDQPVIALDILPTACAVAGARADGDLDGVDILPCLKGEKTSPPHEALYWRFGPQKAIRKGRWKLVDWRDFHARKDSGWQLYDLGKDVGEKNDLAASRPEIVAELRDAWEAWNKGNIAPLWHGGTTEDPTAPRAAAPARPNVLVILADDMGFSDAGCYGGEINTPNLDALAKNGLRFTQFYNTARCWPSRAALLTGYYAQQVRRDTLPGIPSGSRGIRPSWARLLPDMLRPLGYRSYHSGKWHVDGKPLENGFDHSYSLDDHDRYFTPRQHQEDDRALPPVEAGSGYYSTSAIADHAIKCLKEHSQKHSDRPFFEFLAFTAPHFPLHAPAADIAPYRKKYLAGWDAMREERWRRLQELHIGGTSLAAIERDLGPPYAFPEAIKKLGPNELNRPLPWKDLTAEQREFQAAKMAIHAAMVDRMDREIGRVLDQLREMKALDNTLVFFLSDNGASAEIMVRGDGHDPHAECGTGATFLSIGPGWSSLANTPFRRHKTWVHEGGISTPLIVHWPRGIAARDELRHAPGHIIDIVPTILEAAGGRRFANWEGKPVPPPPGKSLVPLFARDGTVAHDSLWWLHEGNRALRAGDWKIVAAGKGSPWELYDLRSDRSESRNLAGDRPEKVKELATMWTKQFDAFVALAGKDLPKEPPEPAKPTSHTIRKIEGWTIRVDDRLLRAPDDVLGTRALRFLEGKLSDIKAVVPADKLKKLQAVTIVLDLTHGKLGPMQYHPNGAWLRENGYSEDLVKCVHIPRAADLPTRRNIREQPWVILHELAHAYHDQVLGFDEPRIREAYEKYRRSGHGEKTLLHDGRRVRAYALTDHKEFFAEMTEAYFGVNDFFPFNRAELKEAEPEIYELFRDIWESPVRKTDR
jgi:arylsulfatase A-like enzyme